MSEPITHQQRKAWNVWAEELGREFNERGLDMRAVLKPTVEIPWDKELVKRHLLYPLTKAMFEKESINDLTKDELCRFQDMLDRHLLQKHDIDMAFPSIHSLEDTDGNVY